MQAEDTARPKSIYVISCIYLVMTLNLCETVCKLEPTNLSDYNVLWLQSLKRPKDASTPNAFAM